MHDPGSWASAPLAVGGSYAPLVHYGSSRWSRDSAGQQVPQCLGAYALLGVVAGTHAIRLDGHVWRLAAGDVAILAPGRPWMHLVAARSRLVYAVGSLAATRLVREEHTFRIAPSARSQPAPAAIWGLDLPVVLPAPVATACLPDLVAVCDLWWRDIVSRMRANHLFAGIFLRAVLATVPARARIDPAPVADPLVRRALRLLQDARPPVHGDAWAALAGAHRNRFAERFAGVMGESPSRYLRRFRLRRAEELLTAGDPSLERVAIESGYRDAVALGRAFRAAHGCSAIVWRRRQAESSAAPEV
ncbi:MAG: hypothetical protein RLZZ127_1411 [Planctomycetota bacterium]|jgi:AraC-like DNA-binding protein